MTHPKASTVMTTNLGLAYDQDDNSLTAGELGPMLISDIHYLDRMAHFDRERIPERVVHAKGAGAHGYFKVTHDVTKFTKAKVFDTIGKITPMFARFSVVKGERGFADTDRDPRGFALKFYTEDGNWDMVANNTPVFFIRDPIKFPDFIHTQKRDPQSNLLNPTAAWDFWSLSPESTHQNTILFSDRGTPDGYRHMHGFGSHTFKWVNKQGVVHWVKYHFRTKSGIKNFTQEQADALKAPEPDYATKDLFNHIESGKTSEWTLFVQIMPELDAFKYRFNAFDVTKVISKKDYPLIPVGEMVINRNPLNYFAETEQVAFSPGNLIPGFEVSPDKMLHGRLFSYPDTQRHRLGPNFEQIPINCPYRSYVHNIDRDGLMNVNGNQGNKKNYHPNSFKTFAFNEDARYTPYRVTGLVGRHRANHPNSDFQQPGDLFRNVMNETERNNTIKNVAFHMKTVPREIQERATKNFYKADPEFGDGIAKMLGFPSVKSRL